jgi:DNA polymerase-1
LAQTTAIEPAMPEPARPRLLLIDGSGYIFRAFFALPPLTEPNGMPVGAVFGFCNMLFPLAQDMPGDQLAVVSDKSKASFRDAIYADYKANRLKPPWTPAAPTSTRSAARWLLPRLMSAQVSGRRMMSCSRKRAKRKGWRSTIGRSPTASWAMT